MSLHVYFDKQVHKKLEKIKRAKKIESLNFAESDAHRKTNARGSCETYNLFFFSLICDAVWENLPHIAQGNFAKIKKISLKILLFFLIFD